MEINIEHLIEKEREARGFKMEDTRRLRRSLNLPSLKEIKTFGDIIINTNKILKAE